MSRGILSRDQKLKNQLRYLDTFHFHFSKYFTSLAKIEQNLKKSKVKPVWHLNTITIIKMFCIQTKKQVKKIEKT